MRDAQHWCETTSPTCPTNPPTSLFLYFPRGFYAVLYLIVGPSSCTFVHRLLLSLLYLYQSMDTSMCPTIYQTVHRFIVVLYFQINTLFELVFLLPICAAVCLTILYSIRWSCAMQIDLSSLLMVPLSMLFPNRLHIGDRPFLYVERLFISQSVFFSPTFLFSDYFCIHSRFISVFSPFV